MRWVTLDMRLINIILNQLEGRLGLLYNDFEVSLAILRGKVKFEYQLGEMNLVEYQRYMRRIKSLSQSLKIIQYESRGGKYGKKR